MNGESTTGVTTMIMAEKLDSGPILLQREIPIPLNKTAGELSEELSEIGAELLIRTMDEWGELTPVKQNESQVSWAPRITKSMARITWEKTALQLHNHIRGLNPWPGAYVDFRRQTLHIWRCVPEMDSPGVKGTPGTFLGFSGNCARILCAGGTVLNLEQVQLPAKSRVTGREFAVGARLRSGEMIL